MDLETYIAAAFPEGLPYNDAAQLCLRLYRTVGGIPADFHSQCSKDGLAEVFARLAGRGLLTTDPQLMASFYGANFHAVHEKGHWTEIIASIFKKGDTVDSEMGEVAAKRLTEQSNRATKLRGLRACRSSSPD